MSSAVSPRYQTERSGRPAQAIERQQDRRRIRLVGGGVAGADHGAEMRGPAEMRHLRAQESCPALFETTPCGQGAPAASASAAPGIGLTWCRCRSSSVA